MASIGNDANGHHRILFVAPDGKRKTVRLGRCSMKIAEGIAGGIETLSKLQGKPHIRGSAAQNPAQSEPLLNDQAPTDQRLKDLIDRWPTLSEADRKRIAQIVGGVD